jgi:hypothetical protein
MPSIFKVGMALQKLVYAPDQLINCTRWTTQTVKKTVEGDSGIHFYVYCCQEWYFEYWSLITVPWKYVHCNRPCQDSFAFLLHSHLYSWISFVILIVTFCCRIMPVSISWDSSLSTLATELLNENLKGNN